MADQLSQQMPAMPAMPVIGEIAGIAGIAMIAEEAAALIAQGAVSGGGKYQFHPDELRSVLAQWKELQATIATAGGAVKVHTANTTPGSMAPGNESASNVAATAAHTTNTAYHDYLTSMQTYVSGYVDALSSNLDSYLKTEGHNSDLANGAHRDLQV
jgi:hypothetical protein